MSSGMGCHDIHRVIGMSELVEQEEAVIRTNVGLAGVVSGR